MEVRWRSGSRFNNIRAEAAYNELEDIKQDQGGVITPAAVVERARDDSNVLHDGFEWNNDVAADKYRLHEARNMIRSIHVIREGKPVEPGVPIYHNVVYSNVSEDSKQSKVYMSLDDIMNDPIARDDLLKRAINEAIAYRKKYHLLSEISQISEAINTTIADLDLEIK